MTTRPDPAAEALRDAFAEEAPAADEADVLERALARANARLDARSASAPRARDKAKAVVSLADVRTRRISPGRRTAQLLVPIAAVLAASLAMASFVASRRRPAPAPAEQVATPAPRPSVVASPTPTPTHDPLPSVSIDELPMAQAPLPSSRPRAAAASEVPEIASAADGFREANAARRAGDVDRAVTLYRELLAAHPASAEADASRVSLGRLLLERRSDARGALAQFDAYLKNGARDRTLAEEARVGKAGALERLGLGDEERRAWQDLLENHPDSLSAPRARARLASLSSPSP